MTENPNRVEELEQALKTATGEKRIDLLEEIVDLYYEKEPAKVVSYAEELLTSPLVQDRLLAYSNTANLLINTCEAIGQGKTARAYLQQFLQLSEKEGDTRKQLTFLNALGIHLRDTSSCVESLEVYQKALRISQENGERYSESNILNNIGLVYREMRQFDRFLEYLERALAIKQEIDDKPGMANVYNNIGSIHFHFKRFDEALKCLEQSYAISRELGDDMKMLFQARNLAHLNHNLGHTDEAIRILEEATEKSDQLGLVQLQARYRATLAEFLAKKGIHERAINLANQALSFIDQIDSLDAQMRIYWDCAGTFAACEEYRQSYECMRGYTGANEKLLDQKQNEKIAEMEVKFETEQRKRETELLREHNIELEAKNQTIETQRRNLEDFNHELIQMNEELNDRNRLITEQKDQLQASFDKLNQAQKEIVNLERKNAVLAMAVTANHEINQPLMVLKGNLDMLFMRLEDIKDEKTERYIQRIGEQITRITKILERYRTQNVEFDFDQYSGESQMVVFDNVGKTYPENKE